MRPNARDCGAKTATTIARAQQVLKTHGGAQIG